MLGAYTLLDKDPQPTIPPIAINGLPHTLTFNKPYPATVTGAEGLVSVSGKPGKDLPDALDISVHGHQLRVSEDGVAPSVSFQVHIGRSVATWHGSISAFG